MKTESNKQIAEHVVKKWHKNHFVSALNPHLEELTNAFEAALDARDERAAKILDDEVEKLRSIKYPTAHTIGEIQDLVRIAAKVRGSKD